MARRYSAWDGEGKEMGRLAIMLITAALAAVCAVITAALQIG